MVEHAFVKRKVVGSIPTWSSNLQIHTMDTVIFTEIQTKVVKQIQISVFSKGMMVGALCTMILISLIVWLNGLYGYYLRDDAPFNFKMEVTR